MTTLNTAQTMRPTGSHPHHGAGRGRLRFIGHFVEMLLSMGVGMVVGGVLGISGVASTELRAILWMVSMIVPMVAWMRFRGMAWRSSWEMSAAMIIPTVALLPFFWAALIPGQALIRIEHLSMAPAMLALMVYRRRQWGW